jgi:hypothetical protein
MSDIVKCQKCGKTFEGTNLVHADSTKHAWTAGSPETGFKVVSCAAATPEQVLQYKAAVQFLKTKATGSISKGFPGDK